MRVSATLLLSGLVLTHTSFVIHFDVSRIHPEGPAGEPDFVHLAPAHERCRRCCNLAARLTTLLAAVASRGRSVR